MVANTPADEIKIDRSLLGSNCQDERTRIILESIFQFAHRLNLRTVAEGVETKEQLGFLRTCNCQLIQGFYFDRPLPANVFRQRLIDRDDVTFTEDILEVQSFAAAQQLLLDAVFIRYPLVIFINLSKKQLLHDDLRKLLVQGLPAYRRLQRADWPWHHVHASRRPGAVERNLPRGQPAVALRGGTPGDSPYDTADGRRRHIPQGGDKQLLCEEPCVEGHPGNQPVS